MYQAVVIGGSAGVLHALFVILEELPADYPIPIIVVQHRTNDHSDLFEQVLQYKSKIRIKQADEKEEISAGVVYVAPPDRHLIVRSQTEIGVTQGEKVGWWRPAVDALFLSAAEIFQDRTVAVVLSGVMWDGAAGMAAVARAGGITIAQDEQSASYFDMPAAALDLGHADVMLNPAKMAEALQVLAEAPLV